MVQYFTQISFDGKISPDIQILASITDDNIPIQPQGNTQQLQDFDQVYIQLFSDEWKLIAGDFWLKKPKGYFLNYQKRGQGASYEFTNQNRKIWPKNKILGARITGKDWLKNGLNLSIKHSDEGYYGLF